MLVLVDKSSIIAKGFALQWDPLFLRWVITGALIDYSLVF